jgi:hypothetical protein
VALTDNNPPITSQQVVEFIETSLAALDEPVDRLIAAYAGHQALDRQNQSG